jgi:hypothetical protein
MLPASLMARVFTSFGIRRIVYLDRLQRLSEIAGAGGG